MEGSSGVIAIETKAGAVTSKVPELVTEPERAVMIAVPGAELVANPTLFTPAIVGTEDVQLTELVRSWVLPSVKVPVAVNC